MEKLARELKAAFAGGEETEVLVKKILREYDSDDWKQYAYFDKRTLRYTRNLVDFGYKEFDMLVLCWPEGVGSPIHDHSGAGCHVKVLQGTLKETLFNWPKGEGAAMNPMQEPQEYKRNQVTYINDKIGLHRMENPSHVEGTVSLHVYSPPFRTCLKFDDYTSTREECGMTFWSVNGKLATETQ